MITNIRQQGQQPDQCQEFVPTDLHDLYQRHARCGYATDLMLTQHQAQEVAARLRGIAAITGVLIACRDEEVKLGDYLRSGLHDALNALADDATAYIEEAATKAARRAAA